MAGIPVKKTIFFLNIYIFIAFDFNLALASSCCGQNSTNLNVMVQRQSYSLNLSHSLVSGVGRVFDPSNGFLVWQNEKSRQVHLTQIGGGFKIDSRLQAFVNAGYQTGIFEEFNFRQAESEMTDTSLGITYELLSEYTFSYYKPTVFITTFINLPTGRSVYEGQPGAENIAVSGHNQWGVGLGVTLYKVIAPWSILIQARSLRLSSKQFGDVNVQSFYDSSVQMILGYSLPFWKLNLNLSLTQMEMSDGSVTSKRVSQSLNFDQDANSRSTALGIGFSRLITEKINLNFIYTDQSLIGRPKNTLITQGANIVLSYSNF